MTINEHPDFYDDLTLSLLRAKGLLETGAKNRKSPAHTPVVATIDDQRRPQQRIMILRHVDWDAATLRFHTDSRSAKVTQMGGFASVLCYDAAEKIQLRLTGAASVITGTAADLPWKQSTQFARRCYMGPLPPGTESDTPVSGLPSEFEGIEPHEKQLAPARGNFAVVLFHFISVDWLYLANSGHRRARFSLGSAGWHGQWLVP